MSGIDAAGDWPRTIILGAVKANKALGIAKDNTYRTAAYSGPASLLIFGMPWLIFRSLASIYFLIVGLFQLLTPFSPTGKLSTLGPYLSNKAIELYLLFTDNVTRQNSDLLVNQRQVRVVTMRGMEVKYRQHLVPGDLVRLDAEWRQEEVPADLLLLYTAKREVFVNMSGMTGEKDPVQRKVPDGLSLHIPNDLPVHATLYTCDPSPDLDSFEGLLCLGSEYIRCSSENLLLAGSIILQGTDVYGVVIATGKDTKVSLNASKAASSSSKLCYLDRQVNVQTGMTLILLATLIFISVVGSIYRPTVAFPTSASWEDDHYLEEGVYILQLILTYFLLYNGLIAQTLQFSLEVVRRLQAFLDLKGQAEVHDLSAVESLKLVDCIVFDKTGTLTTNELVPKTFHCFEGPSSDPSTVDVGAHLQSPLPWDAVSDSIHRLMLCICLNNSASRIADRRMDSAGSSPIMTPSNSVPSLISTINMDRSLVRYFGTSADEVALLESIYRVARYFVVEKQTTVSGQHILLNVERFEEDKEWNLLHVLKYSSRRGKMSVIVENVATGQVYVVTKGSPERVIPLLVREHRKQAAEDVASLAKRGLRVLYFAMKELKLSKESILEKIHAVERDEPLVERLYDNEIAVEMRAVGATGTEDRLQPHLDDAIRSLHAGGLKTLVCTGDIKLTAHNVGLNAGILPNRVFDISIEMSDFASLEEQFRKALEDETDEMKGILFGKEELSVIVGHPQLRELFAKLINSPKTQGVVIYRAGPNAKADLTMLLKDMGHTVACVGDGANDIEMLREAHVGIGILGGENQHAASMSDVAIKTVTRLPEYIFHYGATYWERNVKMTHLISSMKLMVVATLFFYDTYTGYQAKALFKGFLLLSFNFFYGWSVIVYGLSNILYSKEEALSSPALFKSRESKEAISSFAVAHSWLYAILDALFCLWFSLFYTYSLQDSSAHNVFRFFSMEVSLEQLFAFILVMVCVNLKVSLEAGFRHWNQCKYIHFVVLGTVFLFLLVCSVPLAHNNLPISFWTAQLIGSVAYIAHVIISQFIIGRIYRFLRVILTARPESTNQDVKLHRD